MLFSTEILILAFIALLCNDNVPVLKEKEVDVNGRNDSPSVVLVVQLFSSTINAAYSPAVLLDLIPVYSPPSLLAVAQ